MKIQQQVAYGLTVIATRGYRERQNPYGKMSRLKLDNFRANKKASGIRTVFEITQKA